VYEEPLKLWINPLVEVCHADTRGWALDSKLKAGHMRGYTKKGWSLQGTHSHPVKTSAKQVST